MIARFLLAAGLSIVMVMTGMTSYIYLGSRQSKVAAPVQKPVTVTPNPRAFSLPGTLYLAQSGALYSLSAGRWHQLTPEQGWMQPTLFADNSGLLAVKRSAYFSDIYALSRLGDVGTQFTNNQAAPRDRWDTGANAWSFYPRLSPDGRTLWMSYDGPKVAGNGFFDVDLSVWAVPAGASIRQGKNWTNPNNYTGGDMQPVPVAGGAIVYTKYSYDENNNRVGQLWYTNRAGASGRALTPQSAGCSQPSISPDGGLIAMICNYGKQVSYLTVAGFNGSAVGTLTTLISDQMVAQPIWAPDGSGIAYLAPSVAAGPFQLWFLPRAAYFPPTPPPAPTPTPIPGGPHNGPLPSPTPSPIPTPPVVKPIQITSIYGFDATSPMAWAP